ncbi:hypothetical protein GCM10027275_10230 [Rhabdobacter roseus]|uniref:Ig-like domain-containing protein n=1 Tax=Rhabdobacter roseus TaxID=1655419 RepID=A0A840TSH8_9BACT|nr:hypothetical protein [Rhabdobacter roseus]MBB5282928.1 hypothetical protein [Rhabdobacter roseus]
MRKLVLLRYLVAWAPFYIGMSLLQAQTITTLAYDTNGNRLTKTLQGSSPNPSVTASPGAVSLNQASTLTASGCPGTIRWSTGQEGPSISVTPTVTTQYTAECFTAGCPVNGLGQVTVEVYSCSADAIGVTASRFTVRYGETVTLTAYGCPGTVQWSNGQSGFTITPQIYGNTSTFTAHCSKRHCPSGSTGSVSITGISGCLPGDVLVSARAGAWNAPATWACGRVPGLTDTVYLLHAITLDGIAGQAKTIIANGGSLLHLNGGYVTLQTP